MSELYAGEQRLEDILSHGDGMFEFDSRTVLPGEVAYPYKWYALHQIGKSAVNDNITSIEKYANIYGVSKDLLCAIIYLENANGWYDTFAPIKDTIRPGNVNIETWSSLLGSEAGLAYDNADINIKLATIIIHEIQSRLKDPTPAAIATVYQNLRADEVRGYGLTIEYYMNAKPWEQHCFLEGTPISMWDGSKRSIEDVRPGDLVVSYDERGELKPGRVTRTMCNHASQILDLHGLMMTPGHVTLCSGGPFDGQHVPIIDILRSDGALVLEDGTLVRASTGCPVGTPGDQMVLAVAGERRANGLVRIAEKGFIRAGTRIIGQDGDDVSVLELIIRSGAMLTEEGMIREGLNGPDMPFHWTFSSSLPKPEEYVLQRSATQLQDIYRAGEWEAMKPRMQFREAGVNAGRSPYAAHVALG